MRWLRRFRVGVALATAALVVLAGGTALAKSAPVALTTRSASTRMTAPMTIIGVARLLTRTPNKAGQLKVELDNGAIIAIPAADKNLVLHRASAEAKAVRPDGKVHGSCGSSWIYLEEKTDAHPVKVYTGFTVRLPAVAYSWHYSVTGPERTGITADLGGSLAFRTSWSNTYNATVDFPQGDYKAAVTKTSFAVLVSGDICLSLGPTAKNFLSSPDAPVEWKLDSSPIIVTTAPPPALVNATVLPAFAGRAGDLLPRTLSGQDGLKRVTDTTVYPYRAITLVQLFFKHGGPTYCTGFLISKDLVVTAGHCVDNLEYRLATRAVVTPGNNGSDRPFGSCLGTTAYSVTGWVHDTNPLYDYGAIKINCSIGETVGWFGIRSTPRSLNGTSVTITGYPGPIKPDFSMWTASGKISGSPERQLYYTIATNKGESGGPVYERGPYALAVHAYSPNPLHLSTDGGTRITQAAFDNFADWAS
jgi:glutamyl endopeptidase